MYVFFVVQLLLQNVTLVAASGAAAHEAAFFGVPQQSLEEAGGKVRHNPRLHYLPCQLPFSPK